MTFLYKTLLISSCVALSYCQFEYSIKDGSASFHVLGRNEADYQKPQLPQAPTNFFNQKSAEPSQTYNVNLANYHKQQQEHHEQQQKHLQHERQHALQYHPKPQASALQPIVVPQPSVNYQPRPQPQTVFYQSEQSRPVQYASTQSPLSNQQPTQFYVQSTQSPFNQQYRPEPTQQPQPRPQTSTLNFNSQKFSPKFQQNVEPIVQSRVSALPVQSDQQEYVSEEEQEIVQPQPKRVQQKFRPQLNLQSEFPQSSKRQPAFEDEELIKEQNAAAKYAFSSKINDEIQDGSLQREEVRDGLALKGMYSYSDGFFRRTVQYEADENGYRVVKETSEPIGEGPAVNLEGNAQVATSFDGAENAYSITADDISDLRKRKETPALRVTVPHNRS